MSMNEPDSSRSDLEARARAKAKTIVVTGGHPGDPEYGCGGTIARLSDLGHELILLYLKLKEPPDV